MTAALLAAAGVATCVWLWTAPNAAATRLSRLTSETTTDPAHTLLRAASLRLTGRTSPVRQADAWRAATIELCHALAAELSAGRPPGEALLRAMASVDLPEPLREVAAAARDGGDVPAALRAASPPQGGEGFHRLAACWEVAMTSGAALSTLVERVAATLRATRTHRQDVAAQLAGPRATARMLAALPALGLAMAAALGMSPLAFLFGSLPGLGCLVAGVALDVCGLWWTNRMAANAR
ncbi:type II secretion system F family protein [Nonomuraea sp. NBC_01738]|uniref:type II secretion system F family protein n=1 Tax=Nonomuraea sp. NBC_01738 TaxID=2976003 RepID=UPI002E14D29E|nr:type II secretion system F family protein [Nonomuraea sp. NBC_01738]